ncbi:MAG: amino acid synthesis family protein [Gammaproteobacteria bacterium]|nr:MAG: amino acid synthesis family protein [Gammaproteobacteria bacterium]
MELKFHRTYIFTEDKYEEAGRGVEIPLRKVGVAGILKNPYTSGYIEDLSPLINASIPLGEKLGKMILDAVGNFTIQSYGKGGIVGLNGEQEHANALLTTAFANPIRDAIGGAEAWISSMTKVSSPDTTIDIPMNHKDDVYVRSHYDGMSLTLPGTPQPDEIAIIFCVASRGRINARVGGLTHEEVASR